MSDSSQPSIDFSTFVLSLASSAMLHLGKVPDPTGAPTQPNMAMARQSIDMLSMLKEKTEGNLTPDEAQLMARLLHDVRMAWVQEQRDGAS